MTKTSNFNLLEPFPTPEAFETASRAFMEKYAARERTLGPERTNAGWAWKSVASKYAGERGYMARRGVVSIDPALGSAGDEMEEPDDEAAAPANPRTKTATTEMNVVYSPTYRVPMLTLRAWDDQGVPLPLSKVVEYILRYEGEYREDAIMLPGAPFPLLQQTEHPVTGDVVWSVHPCEVRGAVAEVLAAEAGDEDMGVRWLETWFTLSDSVVNLSI